MTFIAMADCPRSSGVYVLIRVVMAPAGGHGMGPYDRRAPVRVEVHASEETVEILLRQILKRMRKNGDVLP
jgi:hypothetical protein